MLSWRAKRTLCEEVQHEDDKVDLLNNGDQRRTSPGCRAGLEHRRNPIARSALLSFAYELETIGDIIDKNLIDLAKKKITLDVDFSKEGWAELDEFFRKCWRTSRLRYRRLPARTGRLRRNCCGTSTRFTRLEIELRRPAFPPLARGPDGILRDQRDSSGCVDEPEGHQFPPRLSGLSDPGGESFLIHRGDRPLHAAELDRAIELAERLCRVGPIEVDVGCGKGGFLLWAAQSRLDRNFLGVERLLLRLRKVDKKILRLGLVNARLVRIEAGYLIAN